MEEKNSQNRETPEVKSNEKVNANEQNNNGNSNLNNNPNENSSNSALNPNGSAAFIKTHPDEKIIHRVIEDEMKKSYLEYSMSVIVGRALPDVRDGLKPVHRRVLFSMHELGLMHNKPYKKCARITGETLGKFHPHGDTAVYDSLVRMAQPFSLRYPLVDGQGNFGCFTKDTKVKLTDGRDLNFEELIREHNQGKKNYTFTVNENHEIGIAEILHARKTIENAELVKVTLDNLQEIRCTPNHKFMLKNGTYKEAKDLNQGESLMPLYSRLSNETDTLEPASQRYLLVHQPSSGKWTQIHQLADEYNLKFDNFLEMVEEAELSNHKVIKVELLKTREDVYDLTINKTHNFALAAGVFVHNSVDGDNAAAMRYCVSGDSLIVTEKGLLRIDEISKQEDVNIKILSKDKIINNASKWFDSGEHQTLKIITNKGYSLRASYNHPVLTLNKDTQGKPIFVWKLLENLRLGDIVVIDRSSDAMWPKNRLDLSPYYPLIKKTTKVRVLPKELDEDLAFILGALISEGSLADDKIEFCNTDEQFVKYLVDAWSRIFPDTKLHKFKKKPSSYGKKEYYRLECHSLYVIEFLKSIGLIKAKSATRTIPKTLFLSPKEVVTSFLKSYFEGDGTITFSSKMIELGCCSMSEQLINELQILLLRFGIDSFKRFDKYKLIWKIYIRGYRNILRFYKELGFISDYKNKKLEYVVYSYKKDSSLSDYVPFISDYIRSQTRSSFIQKNNFDRYSAMANNYEKVCSILLSETGTDYVQLFEYFLTYNYLFEEIVSIQEAGICKVYSLKVESDCHTFISNGFISHNTEARLSKIAEEMLADIEKETVKFQPNFDASLDEPTVLPAKIPNLLINGSSGIAVGMATNIPPHNLHEVIEGVIKAIDNPEVSVEELMESIIAPDFPTGGIICGRQGIINAYKYGRGKIIIRARTQIEEKKKRQRIIITEIPYMVNKSLLIEHIADLIRDKKVSGISDIRDESDREGMRILIELKTDANSDVVINQLYKHSNLQTTFGVIILALVNNIPKVLNLKELITNYIDYRKEIVTNRTKFELKKAQERVHILAGLIIALNDIDNIIRKIKASRDTQAATIILVADYSLSELQAKAILDMKLQRLASLEQQKIKDEHAELLKQISELESILASSQKLMAIIKKELHEISEKYSDKRKTQVADITLEESEIDVEDLIVQEEMVITVTNAGYIKRTPITQYKEQRRGGKGIIAATTRDEDFVTSVFTASTHSYILIFTNKGKVYWLKTHAIPEASRQAKGKPIINLMQLEKDDKINAFIPVDKFDESHYLILATKQGVVKKTSLAEYGNPRNTGIIAINLDDGDELINAELTDGKRDIILATKNGHAIRFNEEDARAVGRTSRGVRGVKLRKDDEVISMVIASDEKFLLSITENGFGKRTIITEYNQISRGGVGVINIQCSERNGKVVAVKSVYEDNDLMLISRNGITIRMPVTGISCIGRNTQGVTLMKLEQDDKVVAAAVIVKEDDEENGNTKDKESNKPLDTTNSIATNNSVT